MAIQFTEQTNDIDIKYSKKLNFENQTQKTKTKEKKRAR